MCVCDTVEKSGSISYVSVAGRGPIRFFAEFGFGFSYSNRVSLSFKDETIQNFEPFYWGRSGTRTASVIGGNSSEVLRRFEENNSFEIMLSKRRKAWIDNQECELKKLALTTKLTQNWASSAS